MRVYVCPCVYFFLGGFKGGPFSLFDYMLVIALLNAAMGHILCILLLSSGTGYIDRLDTCERVAKQAELAGEDVPLILSLAFIESRFNPKAVSRSGAVGVMQVLPKYSCYGKPKCDLVKEGLRIWKRFKRRSNSTFETLCKYNSGNRCSAKGKRYARKVLNKMTWLLHQVDQCGDLCCDC